MKTIIKQGDKCPYTQIPNTLLKDGRLTAIDRLVYCIIRSQSSDWEFYKSQICSEYSISENAWDSGLSSLEKLGWIQKEQNLAEFNKFGGLTIVVYNEAKSSPIPICSDTAKVPIRQKLATNNKDSINNKNIEDNNITPSELSEPSEQLELGQPKSNGPTEQPNQQSEQGELYGSRKALDASGATTPADTQSKALLAQSLTQETPVQINKSGRFFTCFWNIYPKKMHYNTVREIFDDLVDGNKGFTAEQVKVGTERWAAWFKAGKVKPEYLPFPKNFLEQKRFMDEDCPASFVSTDEIVAKERSWDKQKAELSKTPRWSKAFVNQNLNVLARVSEEAKAHIRTNKRYMIGMGKAFDSFAGKGEKTIERDGKTMAFVDGLEKGCDKEELTQRWDTFWASPCFNGLGKPEKTKEDVERWLKNLC